MKKILFFLLISANVFTFAQQTDKEDIKKAIKKESIGGRMDFSKMVEEKYSSAPLIGFGNTLYNKKILQFYFGVQKSKIWELSL